MRRALSPLIHGLAIIVVFAAVAAAADVSGTWKSQFQGRDGQTRESTLVLSQQGDTLTGTVSGMGGDRPIENGTVSGDDLSFDVTRNFNGNEVKFQYKGKVAGDEMKLNVTAGDRTFEMTAKRQK
jgi:hypothetical protein